MDSELAPVDGGLVDAMFGPSDVYVQITEFDVSCFPLDHEERHHFNITVEYRGRGLWAIKHHAMCLGDDGEWDYEPSPSNREDDWLETHRFTMQDAIRLAREAAPKLQVNGWTVQDVKLKREHRTGGRRD
jgi:hypothetical protein